MQRLAGVSFARICESILGGGGGAGGGVGGGGGGGIIDAVGGGAVCPTCIAFVGPPLTAGAEFVSRVIVEASSAAIFRRKAARSFRALISSPAVVTRAFFSSCASKIKSGIGAAAAEAAGKATCSSGRYWQNNVSSDNSSATTLVPRSLRRRDRGAPALQMASGYTQCRAAQHTAARRLGSGQPGQKR